MQKKESSGDGVAFARKEPYEWDGHQYEADIKDGDEVTILDGGEQVQNQFGNTEFQFKIETRNGEKKAAFNQSSINVLVDAYGQDSEAWKGKKAKVLTKKGVYAGRKGIACYFVTEGWYLDDFGELVRNGQVKEIKAEDIPF